MGVPHTHMGRVARGQRALPALDRDEEIPLDHRGNHRLVLTPVVEFVDDHYSSGDGR